MERPKPQAGHMRVVIPKKAAPKRGEIGEQHRGENQAGKADGRGRRPGGLRRQEDRGGLHGANFESSLEGVKYPIGGRLQGGPPPSVGTPSSSSDVKNIVISAIF